MSAIASQITSLTIVYSTDYPGADQSKHQSSASLAFVWGIHRGPVNSPHKWPVTRKMFPFDDVIMMYWLSTRTNHHKFLVWMNRFHEREFHVNIMNSTWYVDFGARSRYLRQGWIITSHRILWYAITSPCLRYLLLAPKSSYHVLFILFRCFGYSKWTYFSFFKKLVFFIHMVHITVGVPWADVVIMQLMF